MKLDIQIRALLSVIILCGDWGAALRAQTINTFSDTVVGPSGPLWSNVSNWSGGNVPGVGNTTENVVIKNVSTNTNE